MAVPKDMELYAGTRTQITAANQVYSRDCQLKEIKVSPRVLTKYLH